MVKSVTLPAAVTVRRLHSFYRPHDRVVQKNELVDAHGVVTVPPSRTKQSFKDECDVNNILKQYSPAALAELMAERQRMSRFGELPSGLDFQTAMNIVVEGRAAFDALPSAIRERFLNDPERFLAFMQDPDSQEEAIKLGLATRKIEPTPEPTLAEQIVEGITKAQKPPPKE